MKHLSYHIVCRFEKPLSWLPCFYAIVYTTHNFNALTNVKLNLIER